jgi:glycosyltransferase involved in cell wall biosynthesis
LEARCQGRPAVFTGVLEGEELAQTYASADAMVFPSTTDTFGNVVLEAQASGVPVIVTDRGGPADIARCYDSGIIVDDAEPGALAGAMERLCLSAELCADLRARGLRNAADCKWEKVLDGFWTRDAQDLKNTDLSVYRSTDPNATAGTIELDLA